MLDIVCWGIKTQYAYSADGRKLSVAYGHNYTSSITDTRYYIGPIEFVKQSGSGAKLTVERINLPWGYFDSEGAPFVNLTDYQGNIRAVTRMNEVVDNIDYYPYGLPKASAPGSVSRYKYFGKEFETRGGLDLYDFDARLQLPTTALFSRPDPKAWDAPWNNTYLYCSANPINRIDPDGMADYYDCNGYLGSDGVDDGRVFVMKATPQMLKDLNIPDNIPSDPISEDTAQNIRDQFSDKRVDLKRVEDPDEFANSFVEIEGSKEIRNDMVSIINQDDGNGRNSFANNNNREFGGYVSGGKVVEAPCGPVSCLLLYDLGHRISSIKINNSNSRFHSHASATFQDIIDVKYYVQYPSIKDISLAKSKTEYAFGRRSKIVYMYNNKGIQAVMTQDAFNNIGK